MGYELFEKYIPPEKLKRIKELDKEDKAVSKRMAGRYKKKRRKGRRRLKGSKLKRNLRAFSFGRG